MASKQVKVWSPDEVLLLSERHANVLRDCQLKDKERIIKEAIRIHGQRQQNAESLKKKKRAAKKERQRIEKRACQKAKASNARRALLEAFLEREAARVAIEQKRAAVDAWKKHAAVRARKSLLTNLFAVVSASALNLLQLFSLVVVVLGSVASFVPEHFNQLARLSSAGESEPADP